MMTMTFSDSTMGTICVQGREFNVIALLCIVITTIGRDGEPHFIIIVRPFRHHIFQTFFMHCRFVFNACIFSFFLRVVNHFGRLWHLGVSTFMYAVVKCANPSTLVEVRLEAHRKAHSHFLDEPLPLSTHVDLEMANKLRQNWRNDWCTDWCTD